MARYDLTPTALGHMREVAVAGRERWGEARGFQYLEALYDSFQHVADRHHALPKRTRLIEASRIQLHRVGSHYIAFVVLKPDFVAITSILHERMDVSTRLLELQARTDEEVGNILAAYLRSLFKD